MTQRREGAKSVVFLLHFGLPFSPNFAATVGFSPILKAVLKGYPSSLPLVSTHFGRYNRMIFTYWFIIIGLLLILLALGASTLKRLPLSTSMLYLLAGVALGPYGANLIQLDLFRDAEWLERLTEVVVIISLFSAGLKLRTPLINGRWRLPVRLAFVSMVITVLGIAAVGYWALGLSLGAAILLGAILAPTDPVLASDVQVRAATDQDRLRFGLTGEAGLNDGSAFPFVMLGLGLLGLHEIGEFGWRWFLVDGLWAVFGGFGSGWLWGTLIGYLMLYIRRTKHETLGADDFLALGLIAFSYGFALLIYTYGFLAVFAAGLALRRLERHVGNDDAPAEVKLVATESEKEELEAAPEEMPAYMAQAVLGFSEQLERIGTVAVVVLLGAMLTPDLLSWHALWFVPLLFLVIRPGAVLLTLFRTSRSLSQHHLIAWFGVRGLGSVYYLAYAIVHDLPEELATTIAGLVFPVIVASIVIHGISVTPLMDWYGARPTPPDETVA